MAKKTAAPKTTVADFQSKKQAKSEIEQLRAELAAYKSEIAELKARVESTKTNGSKADPRRAEWQALTPEKEMAPAKTLLGKAQRMDRDTLLDTTYKAVRALRHRDVPLLLEKLINEAVTCPFIEEKTPDQLFAKLTKKRAYNRQVK